MTNEERLRHIEAGDCPHAILLAGAPESDWSGFARRAAARFLLHTDDVTRLEGCPFYLEASDYAIDPMRDVLRLLNAEAFERGRRCVVLLNAHKMTPLVQNVLLKTLEEPPADTLLLLTGVETGILPTILSRCMIIRAETEPWETIAKRLTANGIDAATAEQCARRADGVYGRAEKMAQADALAFRKGAVDCLEKYRKGVRPLPEAAALCTRAEAGEDGDAKKKTRVSPELVDTFFDVWLELLSDALKLQIGSRDMDNTDCKPIVKHLSDAFTTARIQGMIQTLLDGKRQLAFRATASQTLDWVLCRLP